MASAAVQAQELAEKDNAWYQKGPPELDHQTRALFEEYSGISPQDVVPHIMEQRRKAWDVFQYPCIGIYNFLELAIQQQSPYAEVLRRVKDGERFLDLACCFGQDIRKLVFDGAPSDNIYGAELKGEFVELGYDLFQDKGKLQSPFIVGDFFDANAPISQLDGSVDIIFASSFYHLFQWSKQVDAVERSVRLLRRRPGSLIFGRQIGSTEAHEMTSKSTAKAAWNMWLHNVESFKKLMAEVGERTDAKWRVEGTLDNISGDRLKGMPEGNNPMMIKFAAWME